MLHTISNSNVDVDLINNDDTVLFWQNGVILAIENNQTLMAILAKTSQCFALDNDIIARGLTSLVDKRVTVIDMANVVSLTANSYPQMKW